MKKNIKVSKENWKKLLDIKTKNDYKTLDQAVTYLFNQSKKKREAET